MSAIDAMILQMMSMNLSNIATLYIKSDDYHCIISGIRKNLAIRLMRDVDWTEKSRIL